MSDHSSLLMSDKWVVHLPHLDNLLHHHIAMTLEYNDQNYIFREKNGYLKLCNNKLCNCINILTENRLQNMTDDRSSFHQTYLGNQHPHRKPKQMAYIGYFRIGTDLFCKQAANNLLHHHH